MRKYVLLLGLVLSLILFVILPVNILCAEEWTSCGVDTNGQKANCEYKIENGTLTVRGVGSYGNTGTWQTSYAAPAAPWYSRRDDITNIVVEDSITSIGGRVFSGLSNVTKVELPDSLLDLSFAVFQGDGGITDLKIPSSINSINSYAFAGLNLKEIIVPDSVLTIGDRAFANNYNIQNIVMSDKVSVHEHAFLGAKIGTIYCIGDMEKCKENVGDTLSAKVQRAYTQSANGVTYIKDKNGKIIGQTGERNNKRIYSVEEANIVSGKKNSVMIRYK